MICLLLAAWRTETIFAQTAQDGYVQAEACYRKLRQSARRQKYRDQWLKCIEKFQAVYRQDPSGPWAAAGLYMSGQLYQELYRRSRLSADQQEAADLWERIVKRFPESSYRPKAQAALDGIKATRERPAAAPAAAPIATSSEKGGYDTYNAAEACYQKLRQNARRQKYRDQWLRCIEKFQAVYRQDPSGPWAAAGLYMTGQLYQELYGHSRRAADQQAGVAAFEQVLQQFPQSRYRAKAQEALNGRPVPPITAAAEPDSAALPTETQPAETATAAAAPATTTSPPVKAAAGEPAAQPTVTVSGLRYWSNPSYTRVVIDADQETGYTHRLLQKDPAINKPQRLFVDLEGSRLGKDIEKIIPINDNLLSDVRAGQYAATAVRVVVDIKSFKTYKIFSLKNPFRIVIDVWGEELESQEEPATAQPKGGKLPPGALAKQLALGVSRIVIDAGHGGRDYGAPGYLKGIHEKDVVLQIAQRLAQKVREKLKTEVIMTRNDDQHLTLEERTAIANTKNADLFISVHTNAARDRRAYGIETFFLNLATDEDAIEVAARENATSAKNISDLQTILSDLMQNAKINESSRLAGYVQDALYHNLRQRYSRIKSKGVKQAPFYVLLGAQMPAILIETSFISNDRECNRLTDETYQERMCDAIVNGIRKYIKEINPTAFMDSESDQDAAG